MKSDRMLSDVQSFRAAAAAFIPLPVEFRRDAEPKWDWPHATWSKGLLCMPNEDSTGLIQPAPAQPQTGMQVEMHALLVRVRGHTCTVKVDNVNACDQLFAIQTN